MLSKVTDSCVPSQMTYTRYNQLWITRELKQLTRRKKRAFKKARKSKQAKDIKKYGKLKASTKKACKSVYSTYINNIVDPETAENPKKLWSFIKSKKTDNTGVAPLRAKNGITCSDTEMKVNTLNEQFVSVFSKDEVVSTAPDMRSSPRPTMNHIQVSQEGVFKLLACLQVHKAMDPDEIPSKLLKELAEELTPIFTLYFQASLDQGIVLEDWKSANVVPIFKKGARNKPENYRQVSLTSIVCKT